MKENLEVMEYLAAAEAGKSFLLLFIISLDNMSSVFYINVIHMTTAEQSLHTVGGLITLS